MLRLLPQLPVLALLALLAGCGARDSGKAVQVAYIGAPDALLDKGLRLAAPAQQIRAATAEGLVSLDATGELVPALAERWIVTEDGLSYIFRLRNSNWPDG